MMRKKRLKKSNFTCNAFMRGSASLLEQQAKPNSLIKLTTVLCVRSPLIKLLVMQKKTNPVVLFTKQHGAPSANNLL